MRTFGVNFGEVSKSVREAKELLRSEKLNGLPYIRRSVLIYGVIMLQ
jgi:hypothetical protein